ncbi:FCD domain-containing protein [Vibrio tasmaniensis]|uniref:FCD domain-containing protein n=1 Tax=Vibrio tasmaniensis TaxID=212663 RepID=UPI00107F5578|nr:FCD domain-containing protein [Vibrio tasmaniensis]
MLKRPKMSDYVEDELLKDILSGVFPVGGFLPTERELMERFGVGRPSIREAMFSLKVKGLISIKSGSRTRVVEYDISNLFQSLGDSVKYAIVNPDHFRELREFRAFCEINLIRVVAIKITDEELAELKLILDENKASRGDLREFLRTDIEFHTYIAKVAGNKFLSQLIEGLIDWLIHKRHVIDPRRKVLNDSYLQHQRIYEALLARDPTLAGEAIKEHLDYVEGRFS